MAHHYVVNSGLTDAGGVIDSNPASVHSLILLVVGMWGKIGINSFVLITGYFMCKSNINFKKFLKLFFEIMFYRIIISIAFWITGYSEFSVKELIKVLIPIKNVSDGFTSAYLVFFLFIPFLNVLLKNINERQHIKLLLLCGFLYIALASVPFLSVRYNYVSWFIVLYFISSYIRVYDKKIFENNKFWGICLVITTFICISSVVFSAIIFKRNYYYFVVDSNKILAVIEAVCAFMFFKNLKIKNSKFINTVSSATFGVLLIHANSDTMRTWLWKDLLNVTEVHSVGNGYLHIVLSVLGIYAVCTIIDLIRISVLEKPLLKQVDNLMPKINSGYNRFENKICRTLHIKQN